MSVIPVPRANWLRRRRRDRGMPAVLKRSRGGAFGPELRAHHCRSGSRIRGPLGDKLSVRARAALAFRGGWKRAECERCGLCPRGLNGGWDGGGGSAMGRHRLLPSCDGRFGTPLGLSEARRSARGVLCARRQPLSVLPVLRKFACRVCGRVRGLSIWSDGSARAARVARRVVALVDSGAGCRVA